MTSKPLDIALLILSLRSGWVKNGRAEWLEPPFWKTFCMGIWQDVSSSKSSAGSGGLMCHSKSIRHVQRSSVYTNGIDDYSADGSIVIPPILKSAAPRER